MNSRAILHNTRLEASPVCGDLLSSGSFVITVSALAISFVAAAGAILILDIALGGLGRRLCREVLQTKVVIHTKLAANLADS